MPSYRSTVETLSENKSKLNAKQILVKSIPQKSASYSDSVLYDHGPFKTEDFQKPESIDQNSLPIRIIIPSLSINLPVTPSRIINNRWEISEKTASYGLGSAIPGIVGNSVIFAHARYGMFGNLRNIKKDEKIYILTKQNWYEYKVVQTKVVLPTDIEVIKQTEDETLTLYTCSGFADTKRLIVQGKRTNTN